MPMFSRALAAVSSLRIVLRSLGGPAPAAQCVSLSLGATAAAPSQLSRGHRDSPNPSDPFHGDFTVSLQDTFTRYITLQEEQYLSSTLAEQDLNNNAISSLRYPKTSSSRKKKTQSPQQGLLDGKDTNHPTGSAACPGLLVSYLLADLPGIFTRDMFAAGLQSPG